MGFLKCFKKLIQYKQIKIRSDNLGKRFLNVNLQANMRMQRVSVSHVTKYYSILLAYASSEFNVLSIYLEQLMFVTNFTKFF